MPVTYLGPQLGKYGRQANAVVEFEWVPDPIVFSKKILDVKDALEDRTIPLAISRGIIARDVEANFEGEHDPEGQPWAPWSSAFDSDGNRKLGYYDPVKDRHYKEKLGYAENLPPGHSGKILNWRGILKEAATNESAYVQMSGQSVNNDSLFFDTGGLLPYWVYHQEGTKKMPERRFLGLSDEASFLVLEAFEEWFDGIIGDAARVETFTSTRGRTFARRRIPKGQPGAGQFVEKSDG
jgi:phage gpG-like protein